MSKYSVFCKKVAAWKYWNPSQSEPTHKDQTPLKYLKLEIQFDDHRSLTWTTQPDCEEVTRKLTEWDAFEAWFSNFRSPPSFRLYYKNGVTVITKSSIKRYGITIEDVI